MLAIMIPGILAAQFPMGGWGGYYMPSYPMPMPTPMPSGNMDYLLDPNYAIMQVQQQQAQFNDTFNQLMGITVQQVQQEENSFKDNFRTEYYRATGSYPDESMVNEAYNNYLSAKYGNGSSSNSSYGSDNNYSSESNYVVSDCGTCGGTGTIVKNDVPTFGSSSEKWCDTCNKYVSMDHYHTTCPVCKGSKVQKRRVR